MNLAINIFQIIPVSYRKNAAGNPRILIAEQLNIL
jgi:hypothetical protein